MSRPPLPPRRSVPPVPNDEPKGIAARIASLQLEHIDRGLGRGKVTGVERPPDFLRLISRPPPPIPTSNAPPPPPPRRPPARPPARLPTPPPEPEPEPEASCFKCHDFSYIDAHAAQFPPPDSQLPRPARIRPHLSLRLRNRKMPCIILLVAPQCCLRYRVLLFRKSATRNRPVHPPIRAGSLRWVRWFVRAPR